MSTDQHNAARALCAAASSYDGGDLRSVILRAANLYAVSWGGKMPDDIRPLWKALKREHTPDAAAALAEALRGKHNLDMETPNVGPIADTENNDRSPPVVGGNGRGVDAELASVEDAQDEADRDISVEADQQDS